MLRVGINGFGRIGRAVLRINARHPSFEVVAVNDLDPDIENLAYLLKYDSVYGRFPGRVEADAEAGVVRVDGNAIIFHAEPLISRVPWDRYDCDVIIEASGVTDNVIAARDVVQRGMARKVVITHAPADHVDATIIFGVNDATYDPRKHHVVATSICDANAIAPVLKLINDTFGLQQGFVTTLHPWLSYQNLSDGSVRSVANPGHYWTDFGLGRASTLNLIPKETTAMQAVGQVLPEMVDRIDAMSFRVPTGIVSTSDLTLTLATRPQADDVNDVLQGAARRNGRVCGYQREPLVSMDFLGIEQSFVADGRWTRVNAAGGCRLVLWYDNEWGYSQRVVDMVNLMAQTHTGEPAWQEYCSDSISTG
jgi:glyceraldehyde 3-phosphate dehydrogenase